MSLNYSTIPLESNDQGFQANPLLADIQHHHRRLQQQQQQQSHLLQHGINQSNINQNINPNISQSRNSGYYPYGDDLPHRDFNDGLLHNDGHFQEIATGRQQELRNSNQRRQQRMIDDDLQPNEMFIFDPPAPTLLNRQYAAEYRPPLFTNPNGDPLYFYIPLTERDKEVYRNNIISNGGVVVDEAHLNLNVITLTSKPIRGNLGFLFSYIDACLHHQTLVGIEGYNYSNLPPPVVAGDTKRIKTNSGVRSNSKFNVAKDAFILDQVRENPKLRNSHIFYDKLAKSSILAGHTGNSIRSRYRNHLKDRLDFIYEKDRNGNIKVDINNVKIQFRPSELPSTLKTKYTPEDDSIMCEVAEEYIKKHPGVNERKLPYSFFGEVYKRKSTHSLHSWRDHYRKYFSQHSVSRYLKYYKAMIEAGLAPEPASGDWDGKGEDESALDEEIGEIKNSNAHDVLSLSNTPIPKPILDLNVGYSQDDEFTLANEELDLEKLVKGEQAVKLESQDAFASLALKDELQYSIELKYLTRPYEFGNIIREAALPKIDAFEDFINEIRSVISGAGDISLLFEKLEEIGISEDVIAHALYSCSANLAGLHLFFDALIRRLVQNARSDEIDDLEEVLDIRVPGVWDAEQDALLLAGKENALDLQSKEHIQERRQFLDNFP